MLKRRRGQLSGKSRTGLADGIRELHQLAADPFGQEAVRFAAHWVEVTDAILPGLRDFYNFLGHKHASPDRIVFALLEAKLNPPQSTSDIYSALRKAAVTASGTLKISFVGHASAKTSARELKRYLSTKRHLERWGDEGFPKPETFPLLAKEGKKGSLAEQCFHDAFIIIAYNARIPYSAILAALKTLSSRRILRQCTWNGTAATLEWRLKKRVRDLRLSLGTRIVRSPGHPPTRRRL